MVASFRPRTSRSSSPDPQARNRALLEAMGNSSEQRARLHWRNALVSANLPLVRMVAERQRQRCSEPFDDLVSMGVLGLIRAVEAFDLRRDGSLSSFAVPYIRGAMLHGLRDQGQPLHTPRRLRELDQRARRHLERLRQAGAAAPSPAALADQLGCSLSQLEEAAAVQRALKLRSLDAPCGAPAEGADSPTLLDQLAAPAPATADPQCQWLRRRLAALAPSQRRLLEGHWLQGLGWRDLAEELGLSASAARRQAEALLAELQRAAGQPPSASQPIARPAATAV